MDPLSITASIIAVLGVLTSTTKAAQDVWSSPAELQQLATDLDELNEVAKNLDTLTKVTRFPDDDVYCLEAVFSKLQETRKVFREQLSKRHASNSSTSRFRRRTWMIHRARIKKMTKDVTTIRTQLSTVMQLFTFSSAQSIQSIQEQHSYALTSVDGRLSRCESLFQSLAVGQMTLGLGQNMHTLRYTIDDQVLNNEPSICEVTDDDEFLDCASQFSEAASDAVDFYTSCISLLACPISTSSACHPEDYVTEGPLYERIACFSMIELNKTRTFRMDKYLLLYAQSGRLWRRVTVSATTITSAGQWDACFSFNELYHHVFPEVMHSKVVRMLEEAQLADSITNVSVDLRLSSSGDITIDADRCLVVEDNEAILDTEVSEDLKEIEQRGIRQYLEGQLVVLSRIRTTLYLVFVENQPCLQRNLPFCETSSDTKLYNEFIADMKLLQMAQGCHGVAEFVGVLVNEKRTRICSYLVRYPEAGLLCELVEAPTANKLPISWEQRQHWIRQLLTTVAEIHQRGVVIGCLERSNVWLNLNDEIVIAVFKSTGSYLKNEDGHLPPEVRYSTAPGAVATNQTPTFQSDLFELGLLIWMLAENDFKRNNIFCRKIGCQDVPHYRCRAKHTNPVALPMCAPEVPSYINEIIGHCRQEQPGQRKSACELLRLLPTNLDVSAFPRTRVPPHALFCQNVHCDECGELTTKVHYHCRLCSSSDHFDLCPKCVFTNSIWCYDDSHKLRKRVFQNGQLTEGETYSRWKKV